MRAPGTEGTAARSAPMLMTLVAFPGMFAVGPSGWLPCLVSGLKKAGTAKAAGPRLGQTPLSPPFVFSPLLDETAFAILSIREAATALQPPDASGGWKRREIISFDSRRGMAGHSLGCRSPREPSKAPLAPDYLIASFSAAGHACPRSGRRSFSRPTEVADAARPTGADE